MGLRISNSPEIGPFPASGAQGAPGFPGFRRRLLPLNAIYWFAARLHAAWMRLRPAPAGGPPLVIVGALRAGGSGKTSVTAALARMLRERDLRVGILAWRIGPGKGRAAAQPVAADGDWRVFSDEAVLLARAAGCPVFAVRDRAAALGELAHGPFDILLSDDGFQDRRLRDAFRILLMAPGEAPGVRDLLPAGDFRETTAARSRADLVLEGPWPEGGAPEGPAPEGIFRFVRRFRLEGRAGGKPVIALAGLGDARPFLADLERAGAAPVHVIRGPNHREPPFSRIRSVLETVPEAVIVATRKDAVRLEGDPRAPGIMLVADQEIVLDAGVADRVEAWLRRRRSGT